MIGEEEGTHLELKGFTHRLTLFASGLDYLERDTQVAMVTLEPSESGLLDWEDIEAIHRWSGKLIADRAAHEAAQSG